MITDPTLIELYEAGIWFIGYWIFAICLFMLKDWLNKE